MCLYIVYLEVPKDGETIVKQFPVVTKSEKEYIVEARLNFSKMCTPEKIVPLIWMGGTDIDQYYIDRVGVIEKFPFDDIIPIETKWIGVNF